MKAFQTGGFFGKGPGQGILKEKIPDAKPESKKKQEKSSSNDDDESDLMDDLLAKLKELDD